MTRNEYNDLHESLCYGHDAEISVAGVQLFVEWNNTSIEVFRINNGFGEKIISFTGSDRFETVDLLFAASLNSKTLNDDYSEIQIIDIE